MRENSEASRLVALASACLLCVVFSAIAFSTEQDAGVLEGDAGDSGVAGPTGDTGDAGPSGFAGPLGDTGPAGVVQVVAGTGLAGGTITSTGTLSIAPGGVVSSLIADGAKGLDCTYLQRAPATLNNGTSVNFTQSPPCTAGYRPTSGGVRLMTAATCGDASPSPLLASGLANVNWHSGPDTGTGWYGYVNNQSGAQICFSIWVHCCRLQ